MENLIIYIGAAIIAAPFLIGAFICIRGDVHVIRQRVANYKQKKRG